MLRSLLIFFNFFYFISILNASDFYKNSGHNLSLIYENDANVDSLVDKYYTAGVSFFYHSKEFSLEDINYKNTESSTLHSMPDLEQAKLLESSNNYKTTPEYKTALVLSKLGIIPYINNNSRFYSFQIRLNTEIYTPKQREELQIPGDHPYAGALYASFLAQNRSKNLLEQTQLDLGLIGKHAFAKELQNGIHKITNNPIFKGWDTQLKDEPIVNLSYKLAYRLAPEKIARFFDLYPQINLALGNLNIYAQTSLFMRVGYNLAPFETPLKLKSGFITSAFFKSLDSRKTPLESISLKPFRIFGFAGLGARFVGRNMILQGNSFAPRNDVNIERIVGEFIYGASLIYKRFNVSYSITHKTKEFYKADSAFSFYGAISLGVIL